MYVFSQGIFSFSLTSKTLFFTYNKPHNKLLIHYNIEVIDELIKIYSSVTKKLKKYLIIYNNYLQFM